MAKPRLPGDLSARLHFKLKISSAHSAATYPEYNKIWQDGELITTLIFSKYSSGGTTSRDVGIAAYNSTYSKLRKTFGSPSYINDRFSGQPGVAHPTLEMHFKTSLGNLIVHMRLENSISEADKHFVEWYRERTRNSDLVIYNGHSGLGSNIDRLGKLGQFAAGQYQIFFINGCGTFAYFSEDLIKAHGAVHPGAVWTKHLDVMTNTLASYFSRNAEVSLMLIQTILRQKENYRQILKKIDSRQRVLVDGEQDNLWRP